MDEDRGRGDFEEQELGDEGRGHKISTENRASPHSLHPPNQASLSTLIDQDFTGKIEERVPTFKEFII